MISPTYHSHRLFTPPSFNPVSVTSRIENSIDTDLISKVFDSITTLGMEAVQILCQDKLEDKLSNEEFASINAGNAGKVDWLVDLNKEALEEVQGILAALIDKAPDIVSVFKNDSDRAQRVKVSAFEHLDGSQAYQLFAMEGSIYLRNTNHVDGKSQKITLMTVAQFLTLCKHNLSGSNLAGLDLTGADFSHANLCGVDLHGANLSGADLTMADFHGAILRDSDLKGANLTGADMREVNLCGANLEQANLTDAKLGLAKLHRTNLNRTNLSGADLSGAALIKVNLLGTRLEGTKHLPHATMTLNHHFNRLSNMEIRSLLLAINSIDDQFKELKISLVKQITLDKLIDIDILCTNRTLMAVLMNSAIYLEDSDLMSIIKEKILDPKIRAANTSALVVTGTQELRVLLAAVETEGKRQGRFMLENNGFFVQLMALCANHAEVDIKEKAELLYKTYLDQLPLNVFRDVHLPKINGLDNGIQDTNEHDLAYAFINPDNHNGLLLSQKNIRDMLNSGTQHDWSKAYFVENGQAGSHPDLTHVFDQFPLFKPAYQFQLKNATFLKLLTTLGLHYVNSTNDPLLLSKNYMPLFEDAIKVSISMTKLTGLLDQHTLMRIFEPLFSKDPYPQINDRIHINAKTITEDHYANILDVYKLSSSTDLTKAQTLFCLAALFVNYSSANFFGSESESPIALREYAAALMIKAYELEPTLFGSEDKDPKENFTDWMTRMLGGTINETGNEAAFTCTAVLSNMMIKHAAKQEDFNRILHKMKPPAW